MSRATNACDFTDVKNGVTFCRFCKRRDPGFYGMPFGMAVDVYWSACPERARVDHVESVRARRSENGLNR